jgi:hypothetical protein
LQEQTASIEFVIAWAMTWSAGEKHDFLISSGKQIC